MRAHRAVLACLPLLLAVGACRSADRVGDVMRSGTRLAGSAAGAASSVAGGAAEIGSGLAMRTTGAAAVAVATGRSSAAAAAAGLAAVTATDSAAPVLVAGPGVPTAPTPGSTPSEPVQPALDPGRAVQEVGSRTLSEADQLLGMNRSALESCALKVLKGLARRFGQPVAVDWLLRMAEPLAEGSEQATAVVRLARQSLRQLETASARTGRSVTEMLEDPRQSEVDGQAILDVARDVDARCPSATIARLADLTGERRE